MANWNLLSLQITTALHPHYVRPSLIGGSILLWLYIIQFWTGLSIFFVNTWFLDIGMPSVSYFLWETFSGGFVGRLHSEFANVVFLWIYVHLLTKIWTSAGQSQADHTWFSGFIIFLLTYAAGATGAIMPLSVLSQVTATVIGSAISTMAFVRFSFLENIMVPGLMLTDESLFRVAMIHYIFPSLALVVTADHIHNLHIAEYTDEDEMEAIFSIRLEYADEFFWLEMTYWLEAFLCYHIFRILCDSLIHPSNAVSYSFSNFDYWPNKLHINFTLAVPHWYLRPLMSSLVVIPHHYLGFFYVILFFFAIFLFPSSNESFFILHDTKYDRLSHSLMCDLDIIFSFFFILFVLSLAFTCAVLPTGRYFMALGGSELIFYAFWYIIVYLLFLHRYLVLVNRIFTNSL